MVLDTHRLLIPDVVWMDWMDSDEARPCVFALWQSEDESWHTIEGWQSLLLLDVEGSS